MIRVLSLLLAAASAWAVWTWGAAFAHAIRYPAPGPVGKVDQVGSLLMGAALTAGLIRLWYGRHLSLQEIRHDERAARKDLARVVVDMDVLEAAVHTVDGRPTAYLHGHLRRLWERIHAMQADEDDCRRAAAWPGRGAAARMAARRDEARGLLLRAEALAAGTAFDPRVDEAHVRAVWDDIIAPVILAAAPVLEAAAAAGRGAAVGIADGRREEEPLPLSDAGRARVRAEADRLRDAVAALTGATAELGRGRGNDEFADRLRRAEATADEAALAILDAVDEDAAVRDNARAVVMDDIRGQTPSDLQAEAWRAVRWGADMPFLRVQDTVVHLQRAEAALSMIVEHRLSHFRSLVSSRSGTSPSEWTPLMQVGPQTNLWEEAAPGGAAGRRVLELVACFVVSMVGSLAGTLLASLLPTTPEVPRGTEPFGMVVAGMVGAGFLLLHILLRIRAAQVGGLLAAGETASTLARTRRKIQDLMLGLDEQRIDAVAVLGRGSHGPAQESDQRVYEEALAGVWRVSEDMHHMPAVDRRRRVGRRRVERLELGVEELEARGIDVKARAARALADEPAFHSPAGVAR